MSTPLEQQTDEREALQSIYEGDTNFKEINSTTFQYKVTAATWTKREVKRANNIRKISVWRGGQLQVFPGGAAVGRELSG